MQLERGFFSIFAIFGRFFETPQLVKSNKSISHKKFFLAKFHFLQFQKSIFELGEKFKTAKNAISRKNFFDLFDSTSFFLHQKLYTHI